MRKLGKWLIIFLLAALMLCSVYPAALAEESGNGALKIEAVGDEADVTYSISMNGQVAAQGTVSSSAPAYAPGLTAGKYIITIFMPENVVLTALNGYETFQQGAAQWAATVEAGRESLYRITLSRTGSVEGRVVNVSGGVKLNFTGPRADYEFTATDGYACDGMLPDTYQAAVTLPAGVYADDGAQGAVSYTVNSDGTVTATMSVTVITGETTVLPTITREVNGSVQGMVTGMNGSALQAVTVSVVDESGLEIASMVTDAQGSWTMQDVPYGTYTARFAAPDGTVIPDVLFTLSPSNHDARVSASAGIPASVTVFAFVDQNNNGTQGKNEKGMGGVEIALVAAANENVIAAVGMTDVDGYVTLTAPEGEYILRAVAPEDYGFGQKGSAIRFAHSIMPETTERTQVSEPIRISAENELEIGVGVQPLARVEGTAWHDVNGDGLWQEDEPGIENVRVTLEGVRNGTSYEVYTNEAGEFSFTQIKNGSYDLTYYVPDGYVFTRKANGDIEIRSRMTTEADREGTDRLNLERGDILDNRNVGLMTECVIEGVCFLDANYNGYFDEGEQPLPGVEMKLLRQSNNVLLQTVESDENGMYRFDGLRGSTFSIKALLPTGATYTIAVDDPEGNQFTPNNGKRERKISNIEVEDAGYANVMLGAIRYGSIAGVVYYDDNFSSSWESGEKLAQSVVVTLYNAQGEKVDTSKTNRSGAYSFTELTPGEYRLTMTAVKGHAFTALGEGNVMGNLSDGQGESALIPVGLGTELTGVNIGMIEPAVVTGVVFADANDNGLYDRDEKGLRGTVVKLMTETGEALATEVDKNGEFTFDAVMPGEYYLRYELPENGVFSPRVEGGNAVVGEGSNGAGDWFELASGQEYEAPVCGGLDLGVISGTTFADSNGNGRMDDGEVPIAGVSITLTPTRNDLDAQSIVTGEDGAFTLEGLRPDTYSLSVTCPEEFVLSRMPDVTLGLNNGLRTQTVSLTIGMGTTWIDQRLGCVIPASWAGVAYLDENGDGLRQADEAPAVGETIILRDAESGDAVINVETDETGAFIVKGIAPGEYVLAYQLVEGCRVPAEGDSSFAHVEGEMVTERVVIAENEHREGAVLSIVRETTLSGQVWLEQNGVTTPVSGTVVTLLDANGNGVAEVTTVADGAYAFTGLMPGDYVIRAVLPDGHAPVSASDERYAQAGMVSILESVSGLEGMSGVITVRMAQHQEALNIGSTIPGRLGDKVWLDLNGNGLQDGDEGGIPGVTIELVREGVTVATTVSDQYGYFVFKNIYPTEYTLRAVWPAEVKPTQMRVDLKLIVSILQEDGTTLPVMVESGKANYNADLGFVLLDEDHLPAGYGEGKTQDWTFDD